MKDIWGDLKGWVWKLLKVAVVLSIIAVVVYWIKFSPVPVVSHMVERGTIVAEVMGSGTLEARVQATVSPKISGRVTELLVDQGDRVSAGHMLVRLDDEELNQQVAIAQANLDAASAAIVRLNTDKQRATAVYELARKSQDRIQALVAKNAVTRDEADKAIEALAVAEAGISSAEASISEGQKALVSAEKTLEYHRARLRDTKIHAPFDGMIVKRSREPGDIVVPGSSILKLISTNELWISAWVDETEMARLQPEQTARVVFRSESGKNYPGKVVRLGRETDRETREFIVDISVLELPTNWAVGQRAEVFIQTEQKEDVLLMPARLIIKHDDDIGVFVNLDGIATWKPIVLGVQSREMVEVLEGLATGDSVVVPKNSKIALTAGRKVVIP